MTLAQVFSLIEETPDPGNPIRASQGEGLSMAGRIMDAKKQWIDRTIRQYG
jgi:hypothetical protein